MAPEEISKTASLFTGRWIGETQGYDMPAHIWEITQQGLYLFLATRWENESIVNHFHARIVPGESAFEILGVDNGKATLVDSQHFVIPGWCTNDKRENTGPNYDVIFSRPGIAELTARSAYLKSLEDQQPEEDPT